MEYKEALKDPDAVIFIAYKMMQAAKDGLEEYKMGKRILPQVEEIPKKGIPALIDGIKKDYIGKLSLKEKLFVKAIMSINWNDFISSALGSLSEILLELGKKEDGSYKTTGQTIEDNFKKIIGSGLVGLFDGEYKDT